MKNCGTKYTFTHLICNVFIKVNATHMKGFKVKHRDFRCALNAQTGSKVSWVKLRIVTLQESCRERDKKTDTPPTFYCFELFCRCASQCLHIEERGETFYLQREATKKRGAWKYDTVPHLARPKIKTAAALMRFFLSFVFDVKLRLCQHLLGHPPLVRHRWHGLSTFGTRGASYREQP